MEAWTRRAAPWVLLLAVGATGCGDGDPAGMLGGPQSVRVDGTWSARVVSGPSALIACDENILPAPGEYRGLLLATQNVGAVVVDQSDSRITIRPLIRVYPALTATYTGDGAVEGNTVGMTVKMSATLNSGGPMGIAPLQETMTGQIDAAGLLHLTASDLSIADGRCAISPPVKYEITID